MVRLAFLVTLLAACSSTSSKSSELDEMKTRLSNACNQSSNALSVLADNPRATPAEVHAALTYSAPMVWMCLGAWPEQDVDLHELARRLSAR
jgi:hypothetical protein